MTVRGAKGPSVLVKDILVGEVWLCSGQSNMEMCHDLAPIPRARRPAGGQSRACGSSSSRGAPRTGPRTTSTRNGTSARPMS
ncbi:MAG: hypothetical protein MZV63_64465 [Marinilabiliales bacterium]|nr:hypothetical protein [Marinilabiliales bacterium]